MADAPRRKSPRAPSMALDEALERALKVYDRERLHPAPTEIVAQHIGYKNANNGSSLSALASLRYYGLLERPKEGILAVTKEVEEYKFAPDNGLKRSLLLRFLKCPPLFSELLEKYSAGLPSEPNLRFELIQRGFAPQAAEWTLAAFKRSVDFVGYYHSSEDQSDVLVPDNAVIDIPSGDVVNSLSEEVERALPPKPRTSSPAQNEPDDSELDRIPVRLPGGRKAWLLIPNPFFEADKIRLKAQIDLLLTKEEEDSVGFLSDD